MLCPFKFPLGCTGLASTLQNKHPPIPERGWNMAAQQNTSKSMDRKANSLLSESNQRLTGSQNHRKWELKGNTRLYLVQSFASGKINYTYITPDRRLSNSITSPSKPFQCFCTCPFYSCQVFPAIQCESPLLPFKTITFILDTDMVMKLLSFS